MQFQRPFTGFVAALATALIAGPPTAGAGPVVTDLSEHSVAITANFAGSDILLFGATQGEQDVIVIVQGPRLSRTIRRKERNVGIWMNGQSVTFDQVPTYYAMAATRDIETLLSADVLESYGAGEEHLVITPAADTDPAIDTAPYREALIRNLRRLDLYSRKPAHVKILGNSLFRVSLHFPTNVPVGEYNVRILLVSDNNVVSTGTMRLDVGKSGIEASVYDFAHKHSALYGIVALIIAVVAGWGAAVIFRKA
jgi:uncharacterized protein (TIGR02186 family)